MKVNAGDDQNNLSKSLFETLLFHGACPHHTRAPKGLLQALYNYSAQVAGIVVVTTASPVTSSYRIPVLSLMWEARVPNKYWSADPAAHAGYFMARGSTMAKSQIR